jgi:hypothetical protein
LLLTLVVVALRDVKDIGYRGQSALLWLEV